MNRIRNTVARKRELIKSIFGPRGDLLLRTGPGVPRLIRSPVCSLSTKILGPGLAGSTRVGPGHNCLQAQAP